MTVKKNSVLSRTHANKKNDFQKKMKYDKI